MRFRTKILLYVMILLTLSFSIGGSLLISVSFHAGLESERDNAQSAYRMILYTLKAVNQLQSDDSAAELSGILLQLDSQNDRSWTCLRLLSGEKTVYAGRNEGLFVEAKTEPSAQRCVSTYFTGPDGTRYLQISGNFLDSSENAYRLEVLYDISSVYNARDSQVRIYRWVFGAVLLCGLLLSWIIASRLTAPLRRLSQTARAIAQGELDSRADIHSQDEVGQLAMDFNGMADNLQEKIEQLQESMRRQEEFMGSFAHELKTPMTSVIGYADLMRGRDLNPEEQREAANYVFKEARRLEALSIKLLDLLVLQRQDFPLTRCSPKALLGEVAQTLAPALYRSGIRLRCRGEEGSCLLEPDLVKSLLTNLIDNARKSMDNGGVLRVDQRMEADGCRYVVTDQGRGMEAEALERITEAFYRIDKSRSRAQGGAGLGLALCREIVRLHKGEMQFYSQPGKGTQVVVTLKGGRGDD